MKKLFNQETYTSEELISLLLPKLQQRGIRKITEEKLSKDLYYYSVQPKFKNLFVDMNNNKMMNSVDIYNAMFIEKYLIGSVKWDDMRPTKLFLAYPENFDFSYGESLLTDEGLLLVNTIADELSIKYKVEAASKNKMNIYNVNPNQNYTLVYGINRANEKISWELITDGNIGQLEKLEQAKLYSCERPSNISGNTKLSNPIISEISIENATYAVMQGFENGIIKGLKVYTNLTDLESLQQISQIANNTSHENEKILLEDRPFVKKIVLN